MSTLLSYSGLTTKIRAMESHLLTDEDYRRIADFTAVGEVVSFLKQIPGYREAFANVDEAHFHRGEIEHHMTDSIYWGFSRLYRFADQEQKKFLNLYFQRYEIFIIKRYFHRIEEHKAYTPRLGDFEVFFRKHTQLDLERLSAAGSMDELIRNLEGTEYYQPLAPLAERTGLSSFDYEMALDLYYFRKIWKEKDKILSGQDLESLTKAYGVKFELINLGWICRAKKYYRMSSGEIYNALIPLKYKLKKEEVAAMVEANTLEELSQVLARTYYAEKFEELTPENIEKMYVEILKHTLGKEARNHPYSAAIIYSYLFRKEHEVDRLTTALECIRYGLDAQTTYEYIVRS